MPWTSVDDVLLRWTGADVPTNEILVAVLIDDAELLIDTQYPGIDDRSGDDDKLLNRVRYVVSQMVMRCLRNPDGVRSMTLGDGSITYSSNHDVLKIDPAEHAMLGPAGTSTQRAFTINPTPIVDEVPTLNGAWVNGPLGTEPGSW